MPVDKIAWLVLLGVVALVSAYVALTRWAIVRVPAAVIQSDVIALTNDERTENDLGVLTENPTLDKAAQAKANDMAAKGYFSHTGPDGQPPWHWFVEAGYDYHYAGENLAVRFDDSKQVVDAWMASPTHRANIVKPVYTQIGIGVADGMYQGLPATFVVQFFGTPEPGDEPVEPKVSPTPSSVAGKSAAQPVTAATAQSAKPTVAGAETTAPGSAQPQPTAQAPHPSIFSRITGFFAYAWASLTASAADSGGVIIDEGVSTER